MPIRGQMLRQELSASSLWQCPEVVRLHLVAQQDDGWSPAAQNPAVAGVD